VGSHRGIARGSHLNRIAQVVPDLATFAVDDGFAYRIPDGLAVDVGNTVRIPLGGRRVRGWVVDVRDHADAAPRKLKDVVGVSGEYPVFHRDLLATLRWTAMHYVAPLAAVLARSAPPNLPRRHAVVEHGALDVASSPLPGLTRAAAAGRHHRTQYLLGSGPWSETVARLSRDVLASERSVLVVLATRVEAEAAAAELTARFGDRLVVGASTMAARELTTAWVRAATAPGSLVVGTSEVAWWPVARIGLAVVIEEGRRGMKGRQTPTVHVRELLRRRASIERFPLVFAGPVPTSEMVAAGAELNEPAGRVWGLVEVVDRTDETDRGAVISPRVRAAVRHVAGVGRSAFVLVHRHGYAPAFRCIQCGTVRRCPECGAASDRGRACRRCGHEMGPCADCGGHRFAPLGAGVGRVVDELKRSVGDAAASAESKEALIEVGTERDLPSIRERDLAVVVDADAWLLAPHYRAEEEALRLFARLAGVVGRGSGRRTMIQTTQPDHRVIEALRSGHPSSLMATIATEREEAGFPPAGDLLAIDVTGPAERVDAELRATVGDEGTALGPAPVRGQGQVGDTSRWLIQGRDLHQVRIRLRSAVQRWRDAEIRVRIDADPIDL
jgi:primosomal protein N' (replication factor Y)